MRLTSIKLSHIIILLILFKQLSQSRHNNDYKSSRKRTRDLSAMNHLDFLSNGDECITNVECPTTCCKQNKCVSIQKCKDDVTLIYIIVGALAGSFLVVVILIFAYLLVETKRNIENIRIENQQKAQALKSKKDDLQRRYNESKRIIL